MIEEAKIKNLFDFIQNKYLIRKSCNDDKSMDIEIYGIGSIYSVPIGGILIHFDKINLKLEILNNSNNAEILKELVNDVKEVLQYKDIVRYLSNGKKTMIIQFSLTNSYDKKVNNGISLVKEKNKGHK